MRTGKPFPVWEKIVRRPWAPINLDSNMGAPHYTGKGKRILTEGITERFPNQKLAETVQEL